ncbi:hypothetical protein [Ruegeria sp. HKCCA0370]|uniref:hypothetical protein n=1 Tax=Ruegeria sp. HKCCA0370 TaxID=2682995 RepID=UPI0014891BC2|nr:hypothetical protein [Ruegeria sp. HKCCA0370]
MPLVRSSKSSKLTRSEKLRISHLRVNLLSWFDKNGRDLPWRSLDANEFERICVEVLLQRTRAETVAGMYRNFFSRYPSWNAIALAPVEELECVLKPIGLWRRRARSLRALASYAAEQDGHFPSNPCALAKVPAVGQYVGNAILLFQHGQPRPLVDVNMARVLERYLRPRRLADIRHDPWLQEAAHWLVKCANPIRVNWAVLDFAAGLCRARNPRCNECCMLKKCDFAGRVLLG